MLPAGCELSVQLNEFMLACMRNSQAATVKKLEIGQRVNVVCNQVAALEQSLWLRDCRIY